LSDLLATSSYASDVYIEGQGWFIFGWADHLETSQKLVDLESKWVEGPDIIAKKLNHQCAVKVSFF